jgi:hypothetical protein
MKMCRDWKYNLTHTRHKYSSTLMCLKTNHTYITSALEIGDWSAAHPSQFTPQGMNPLHPLERNLGGLTADLVLLGVELQFLNPPYSGWV